MKRIIAWMLSLTIFMTGCTPVANQSENNSGEPEKDRFQSENGDQAIGDNLEVPPAFISLDDQALLSYVENETYAELIDALDDGQFFVETVSTSYVSKEYLEELEYNSKANIFFGYNLEDLDAMFNGKKYVFTLNENGKTDFQELVEVQDGTYGRVVKNVAVGSGVILVTATVAIITKNPAASATAGRTVKMIFAASSAGAKAGSVMAAQAAGIGGIAAAIMEGIKTEDLESALKAGLVGASESFKVGAIFGTVKGIADGIRIVGNSRFFPSGSEQAAKYPEGVEFTQGPNGQLYPRFEKWKIAEAKFGEPNTAAALNHTGLSGNYAWDAKLANQQCGLPCTPRGYVWHHKEDMRTLILIPQDLHSVAMGGMPHYGGASLIRAFLKAEGAMP